MIASQGSSVTPATEHKSERPRRRRGLGCAFEVVETLVLTLLIYLVIHLFVAQPFEVKLSSMSPTIVEGEYILIDKLTPRFGDYHYGDVVVFEAPDSTGEGADIPFIKRVVALPGDTVHLENGRVFVTQPGEPPVRIEESYLSRDPDGSALPTSCPVPTCPDQWVVPDGSYFVMGDNRPASSDSRAFGPIGSEVILGRAWVRYFPLDRVGLINDRSVARALEDR